VIFLIIQCKLTVEVSRKYHTRVAKLLNIDYIIIATFYTYYVDYQ